MEGTVNTLGRWLDALRAGLDILLGRTPRRVPVLVPARRPAR